jgi:hypothetical protein
LCETIDEGAEAYALDDAAHREGFAPF